MVLFTVIMSLTAYTAVSANTHVNSTQKINNTSQIIDKIGYKEATYGDVQGVTYNGSDDASVLENYGDGDCWADATWLYEQLNAAGVQVRIMGYVDRGTGAGYRHTWIEINTGDGWQSWNYTKYNSQHYGDVGAGTPFVLIGPGNANPDIMSTGY